jgi:hypothetical protein
MYRTSTTRWRSAIGVAVLLAGCSGGGDSGPIETQQRQVADFHAIELRGAGELVVTVGQPTSFSVSANSAVLDKLRTEVKDGKLFIEHEPGGWRWFGRGITLKLALSTPALDDLTVNGAGHVSITGATGAKLELEVNGAGNLDAAGVTQQLDAHINGAGDMDLSRLVARDAKVSVNGAGNMQVHATGALEATVNGVGSIGYAGNPQPVQSAINGVGSIKPVQAATGATPGPSTLPSGPE